MIRMWLGILLLAIAFAGCDAITGEDDDNSGGASKADLKNTEWFGPMQDVGGTLYRLNVIFDGDGNIGDIELDLISQGITGEVNHEQGDIFSFLLDDGTLGGFLVSGDHTAFVTEDQDLGALEKGATTLQDSYTVADLEGTWSGYTVLLDAEFSIADTFDSEVTVESSGEFTGSSDDGTTFESFTALDVTTPGELHGRYYGQSIDQGDTISNIDLFITPDKQFAASQAQWGTFPDEVTFNSWEKQ